MKIYTYHEEYLLKKEVYNPILKSKDRVNINWDQLKIGEFAYINNTENKIKKVNESEFTFYRFEDVTTHIENYKTLENANSIYYKIIMQLDYSLKYADDRIKLVEDLLKDNEWIYDLVSDNDVIKRTHKKKKDFLAENQTIDRLFDSISTYINFAKFKNEEDEKEYYKNKTRLNELLKIQEFSYEEKLEYDKLMDYFSRSHHKTTFIIKYSNTKEELVDDVSSIEDKILITEEQKYRQKKLKENYKIGDLEIPKGYFLKMFGERTESTLPYFLQGRSEFKNGIKFRYCANRIFEREIKKLGKYLGMNIKDKKEKEEFTSKLIKRIGKTEYNKIKKMYISLKSNHAYAKEILVDMVKFTRVPKSTTEYDINSDTWYINSNGELIEISKNFVSLADPKTYRGLIINYFELKDKYVDKMHSDIWALLFVFEDLLNKCKLNDDEIFVLKKLLMNYTQKDIIEEYEIEFNKTITNRRLSNMINNTIPNKILNTYLDSIEEWLYTDKLKGTYKKCSKCGEVKILSERYFRKDPLGRDGFRSQCRNCEVLAKKRNFFKSY